MSDPLLAAAALTCLDLVDEGVVVRAVDDSTFFCNPAAERILGLTYQEMRKKGLRDPRWSVSRSDGSEWSSNDFPLERALRGGHHTERAMMHIDRGTAGCCSILVNARPVVIDADVVGAVATFTLATVESGAISQTGDNERQLLRALHSSGLAVATSDRRGNVQSANTGFAEMLGRTPAELEGMHFTEFSGPDALEDQIAAVERLRAGKDDQFRTLKSYVRPDGSLRHGLMNLLVLRNRLGEVERHVSLVQDVTEQLRTEAALTVEARTDPLSGLLNRRGVLAALDEALGEDSDRKLLVAFVDLDGFKGVNDTHGHEVGDEVLRMVSTAMQDSVRGTDVLGRLGGDEFVVVFMDAPTSSAHRLAESLRAAVEAVRFDVDTLPLTASVGIVAPEAGETAPDILRRADAAMYARKRMRSITEAG